MNIRKFVNNINKNILLILLVLLLIFFIFENVYKTSGFFKQKINIENFQQNSVVSTFNIDGITYKQNNICPPGTVGIKNNNNFTIKSDVTKSNTQTFICRVKDYEDDGRAGRCSTAEKCAKLAHTFGWGKKIQNSWETPDERTDVTDFVWDKDNESCYACIKEYSGPTTTSSQIRCREGEDFGFYHDKVISELDNKYTGESINDCINHAKNQDSGKI